ncbi:MAG: efflux RND transporter permease subunit [Eubacteriales bacterium]|nr:efflux RND transporter permease subunit [Eubacteriales bacterium]
MNLTKLVLRRPVSTALVVLGIVVFGLSSLFNFNLELIPDIQMPMMLVNTVYPGADPDSIDALITKEIEDAGASLSGVESYMSYSYENYSIVAFTYNYEQDMNDAYTDLSAALDALDLPEDAREPVIMQMDVNAMDTMTISVTNDGSSDMMAYIEDNMVPQLESVSNVAKVAVTGGAENFIRVQLDEQKLNQYGLNINSVASFVGAADYNIPAGTVTAGSQDVSVSASDSFLSLEDLKRTTLTTATGSLITLGDVADISFASKEPESISRYNGQDNVTVGVTKNQSASTVKVTRSIKKVIKKLEASDPGVKFEIIYDSGAEILSSLSSVLQTLVLGVILAMAVLFLFFGDWKASLIVGSSMPLSILATLVIMYLMGFSMNIITTGALVIAIGMIVDNSIVVLESCFRIKEECDDFVEAAVRGTETVMLSIAASTLTTIVVYLPLSIMKGMVGQMFGQLGYIIVFAMLSSLISALCITPLMFTRVRPREKRESRINLILDKTKGGYDRLLRRLLYRKKTTLAVSVGLLVITFFLASSLPFELMPVTYDGSIKITADFRSGTKLSEMDSRVAGIEEMVAGDANFENYSLSIANNQAVLSAYAVEDCKRSSQKAVEEYTKKLGTWTDMDVFVEASGGDSGSMGSFATDQVQVVLTGNDLEALSDGAFQVEEMMRDTPGVIHVSSDAADAKTTAHVVVDPMKAAHAGLSPAMVAADLYSTLTGVTAANMEKDGKEYDIILNYPDGMYENVGQLMGKSLTGQTGKSTMLSEIAHLEYDEQLQMIQRADGRYQVTISATVSGEAKQQAAGEITKKSQEMEYPEGVSLGTSMMTDTMNENLGIIFRAILAGIFLVFLVMAMQFESPRFSIMVMTCIPFSLIGSFLLLFLSRSSLNMVSMMGFLMLMGIVVNNGILLVDTINQEKERRSLEDALVEAGKIRLRPILMTTLTTILAMIPMIVGSDNEMMQGMGLVIVGGLVASTLLCLLMMPTFYLIISRKEGEKGRWRRKRKDEGRLEEQEKTIE